MASKLLKISNFFYWVSQSFVIKSNYFRHAFLIIRIYSFEMKGINKTSDNPNKKEITTNQKPKKRNVKLTT